MKSDPSSCTAGGCVHWCTMNWVTLSLEIHWSVNSNTIQCDAPTNGKIVYCDNTLTHLHSCALKETGATTVLEDYLDNDHHVTSISEIPPTHHSHSHSLVRGDTVCWPTFSTGCTSYTVQRQAVITPPVQQGMRRDPRCLGNRWRLGGGEKAQVDWCSDSNLPSLRNILTWLTWRVEPIMGNRQFEYFSPANWNAALFESGRKRDRWWRALFIFSHHFIRFT